MDAVTYPHTKISQFVDEQFIPIRVGHDAQPISTEFNVHWTPTLIVLDIHGKEHYRSLGFVPVKEFIPTFSLGIAKLYFDAAAYDKAIAILDTILSKYPESTVAPESVYFRGVSFFESTHEVKWLKEIYQRISKEYPNSEWVYRSSPYRLLKVEP